MHAWLPSQPSYYLTAFVPDKWALKKMDKLRRNFLWDVDEHPNGKSMVNWQRVCSPKNYGGLGIPGAAQPSTEDERVMVSVGIIERSFALGFSGIRPIFE